MRLRILEYEVLQKNEVTVEYNVSDPDKVAAELSEAAVRGDSSNSVFIFPK